MRSADVHEIAKRAFALMIVSRLGRGMDFAAIAVVGLQLVDISSVGIALGAYAICLSVGTLGWAQLVDRRGPQQALLGSSILHASATAAILLSSSIDTPWLFFVSVAFLGIGMAPTGICVRIAWLNPDAGVVPRVFRWEAIVIDVTGVVGPLAVGLLVAIGYSSFSIATSSFLQVVGSLGIALTLRSLPIGKSHNTVETHSTNAGRNYLGIVARFAPALFLIFAAVGCIEIAAIDVATKSGSLSSGVTLAVVAVGGVLAVLSLTFVFEKTSGKSRLFFASSFLCCACLVSSSLFSANNSIAYLLLALLVAGAGMSVALASFLEVISLIGEPNDRARIFASAAAVTSLGNAFGTVLASSLGLASTSSSLSGPLGYATLMSAFSIVAASLIPSHIFTGATKQPAL